ncbi:hypothetical protein [Flavobacterium sp. CS20]|uniref:hypothetical protein n=1 Tax=Flavobacterium sp. CS20 TaxID=2775246 RepID=UPI001B3A0E60|nr:hypothetical protein [Flavobacterium sp. CS20]QTY26754.1 hypothetical protein IGB25_12845 [Flavobacterium sp. CS20]
MIIQKKHIVLSILFILPLFAYMFFASGVNHFAKLDTLSENVLIDDNYNSIFKDSVVSFDDKITILSFLGSDVDTKKAFAFNLKEKIYDRYKDFKDLQFISVIAPDQEAEVESFVEALNYTSDADKWFFVELDKQQTQALFESLETDLKLDKFQSTNQAFIIDKNRNLRGRLEDEDGTKRYAYDMSSVAELSDEMNDDVKVILAEYRLALKKYNKDEKE